jgi:hypothetical protein
MNSGVRVVKSGPDVDMNSIAIGYIVHETVFIR